MTAITLNAHTNRPTLHRFALADLVANIFTSLSEVCAGARDGREIQARYETYARMSKFELAQRGMSRPDIYRAALLGRNV